MMSDYSDGETEKGHERLISEITQHYCPSKVSSATTRTEHVSQISEFHLQNPRIDDGTEERKQIVNPLDLIKSARKKQPKLVQKIRVNKKPKVLQQPLETVQEEKAKREYDYDNVKKELSKWQTLIESNRVADQIKFPLRKQDVEIYHQEVNQRDILSTFRKPTPFEEGLSQLLSASKVVEEDRNQKREKESKYNLTLKELLEKRRMYMKMRMQASYKIAKSWRQNKIKSKRYHRILRKDREKKQQEEFEMLEKTDPDRAQQQMEQLERDRAKERATLRHRNTGRWAKSQIAKGQYNTQGRIALSEQLTKSRELTQKVLPTNKETESSENDDDGNTDSEDQSNDTSTDLYEAKEYNEFITGYRKFWEEQLQTNIDDKIQEDEEDNVIQVIDLQVEQDIHEKNRKEKVEVIDSASGKWTMTDIIKVEVEDLKMNGQDKKTKKRAKENTMIEIGNNDGWVSRRKKPKVGNTNQVNVQEKENILEGFTTLLGDSDDEKDEERYMTISEAFQDDDVIAEFREEKKKIEDSSKPKEVDNTLPGWGSWTGDGIKPHNVSKKKKERISKRLLFKVPKAPPRKDSNKGFVIINQERCEKLRKQMVTEVPHPFISVKEFEESIRAPMGRTWVPETAHHKLIAPAVVTKLGSIIEPIDKSQLVNK